MTACSDVIEKDSNYYVFTDNINKEYLHFSSVNIFDNNLNFLKEKQLWNDSNKMLVKILPKNNYYWGFGAIRTAKGDKVFSVKFDNDFNVIQNPIIYFENDTIEIKAEKMFGAYQNTDISYGSSPVPKTVALKTVSLQGRTIVLDFNKELLSVYKDKKDLRHMMVESLMYSFTTIPGVDSIRITAEGEEISDFIEGLDTKKVLYPPEFINPETVETQQ